jgi:hypothetical protein
LKDYLLSKELFWQMRLNPAPGERAYPKLTVGNLLFFLQSAKAYAKDISQESEIARLETELGAIIHHWQTAWGEKASHEFTSRLRQWSHYLGEVRGIGGAYYANEVRLRVLLELLLEAMEEAGADGREQLAVLDGQLKGKFVPGDFIWEEDLSRAFPQETFWYLYGGLKK